MRVIGLTGGIATGKSTVAALLARRGVRIVDADILAREAVAPGSPLLDQIVARYGQGIRTTAGALDRAALAQIVFADAQERRWVEALIHPYVREHLERAIQQTAAGDVLCLVVPLLFEARMGDLAGEIWVVSSSPRLQRERLKSRDGLKDDQIEARIAAQMPLEQKERLATVVLKNNGDLADLEKQVEAALDQALT
ncbi:dephospho-CoA kinase [Gloeobacter kilaueensis]|uniref:Dephospho-CoA kinase n=1 Tax=Gloeobacter kilaueensis (strain ATCC BAA-2537 / CCAP 1431/1 / ULC 316 / JS1) TaxID=1183438 RepID=U5QE70_GLOK1|nr:dephospho-CoA kinase [Gloeobacter kilaueensis]AGY57173.1 dephospho-CoA kinase [Gloeobacter kilaueensis JS1]